MFNPFSRSVAPFRIHCRIMPRRVKTPQEGEGSPAPSRPRSGTICESSWRRRGDSFVAFLPREVHRRLYDSICGIILGYSLRSLALSEAGSDPAVAAEELELEQIFRDHSSSRSTGTRGRRRSNRASGTTVFLVAGLLIASWCLFSVFVLHREFSFVCFVVEY